MDYCNAVWAGIPLHLAWWLQLMINAAARLVFASSKYDYITPLLCQLHCLKVHGVQITSWPLWLTNVFMAWHHHTSLTNFTIQQSEFRGICVLVRLTNCRYLIPASQTMATVHFQSPLYGSGTVFRSISHLLRDFSSSALT